MAHHSIALQRELAARGFQLLRYGPDRAWYITPKSQLIDFDDTDLILLDLQFAGERNK